MKHYELKLKDDLGLSVKYVESGQDMKSLYREINNKYKETV